MRHYEIVLLIHPDQSEQVPAMLERYKGLVTAGGGKVHRSRMGPPPAGLPDPEARQGALPVPEHRVQQGSLAELETGFRFNDAVLRHLTVVKAQADTTPSMMKMVEKEESRKARRSRPPEQADADGHAGRTRRASLHPRRSAGPGRWCSSTNPRSRRTASPEGLGGNPGPGDRGDHATVSARSNWANAALPASSPPSATAAASSFT
jgi:small subunit ribosomal protein S6